MELSTMSDISKIYGSKREIFKDYEIALRFLLINATVDKYRYNHLYDALKQEDAWKIEKFSDEVRHLKKQGSTSVGLFAEVPIKNKEGKVLGTRFVLLEHETGLEIFIPIVITAAASGAAYAIGKKVAEKVADKALDKALDLSINKFSSFMKKHWAKIMKGKIEYVEIRTLNKGNMRIAFADFEPTQISCLVKNFKKIKHLSDVNQECFQGKLFAPDKEP
jgi:hypothetical protein